MLLLSIIAWFIGGIISGISVAIRGEDKKFGFGLAVYNTVGLILFLILGFYLY